MGLRISDCEYQVGDEVVVSEGVKTCSYGCSGEMMNNIGRVYTVLKIEPDRQYTSADRHPSEFCIYINDMTDGRSHWIYDEGCFEPINKVTRVFESANIEDLFS